MAVKEYLSQLIHKDNEIKYKLTKLDNLKAVAYNSTPNYGGEKVQQSRNNHSLENIMAKIVDLDREIDSDIDEFVDMKVKAWELIDKLSSEKLKMIIWNHYAQNMSWKQIADAENITRRHAIRLYSVAMAELEKIFKN